MTDRELSSIEKKTEKTILHSQEWKEAEIILTYLSFDKEISLDSLIRPSLEADKKIYVPLITGQGIMDFHRLENLSALTLNRWGIREPSPDRERFVSLPGQKVLILTPGLGFGSDGRRMGRGGGYYDRFLSRKREGMIAMGICWDGVLREDIPMEERDCPVDLVCLGDRILRPQG